MSENKIRLTQMATTSGWAAKKGPETLAQVLGKLPKFSDPMLLVGTETSDDAAVYKINDGTAIIQTVDFFTPVVDDPYLFGQIAAANSLSDVYAMGGEPRLALNIAAFPDCLDIEILGEILKGGADKIKEAGALLAGGHTISDDVPKYGLCVTGFVNPEKMWKNCGAQPGDILILTKPLGTGILSTAIKGEMTSEEEETRAAESMALLNKYARDAAAEFTIHSCTDITGFGFAGHAMEMAKGSDCSLVIYGERLPVLKGAKEYAQMGLIPAGAYRNREYLEKDVDSKVTDLWLEDIFYDPQTSGGLLLSVKREEAESLVEKMKALSLPCAAVGEAVEKKEKFLIYR